MAAVESGAAVETWAGAGMEEEASQAEVGPAGGARTEVSAVAVSGVAAATWQAAGRPGRRCWLCPA